jgi:uncharacterized RDD family membrane protein YckC
MLWFRDHYLRSPANAADWRALPIKAPSLAGVVPAVVITAECDVLHDEGERYAGFGKPPPHAHIRAIAAPPRKAPVTANFTFASAYRDAGVPDPATRPELFDGVLWRRSFAYLIDAVCIGALVVLFWLIALVLTVLSLGLLWPILHFALALVPLAYHTLLLSGPRASTWGMRCFDLELRSWTGERPSFLQALAQTALFYVTVGFTCSLILLFALFNRRKRTLHDVLAGTLMIRSLRVASGTPPGRW